MNKQKVCVLVDHTVISTGDAGRNNYWGSLSEDYLNDYEWEYLSIEDLRRKNIVFNFDAFDIVILNVDVANADFVFDSHITWLYFLHHGKIRTDAWFRRGVEPKFILEHQGIRLVPSQVAYDSILGKNQVTVSEYEPYFTALSGDTGMVVNKYSDHPVLKNIERLDCVASTLRDSESTPFFGDPPPRWLGREGNVHGSVFDKERDAMYGGWFETWSYEWVPLLMATGNKYLPEEHAILLIKVIDEVPILKEGKSGKKGIIFASTMRLAASTANSVIDGIIKTEFDEIVRYHRALKKKRNVSNIIFFMLVAVSLIASMAVLLMLWKNFFIGTQSTPLKLLQDAVGLPLVGLWYVHWLAIKKFFRRPCSAQPSWKLFAQSIARRMKKIF